MAASIVSTSSSSPPGWLLALRTPGRWLSSIYVVFIALLMSLTGWIALDEGLTRYLPQLQQQAEAAPTAEQVARLRANPSAQEVARFSRELSLLGQATSLQRFTDSRLVEHGLYLASMPRLNKLLLTSHILTGVLCMAVGGFQFWPAFRRRYMRLHRLIGAGYIITAPISVVLSLAYMLVTPPDRLYTHFTAFVALWVVGGLAIASIALAIRALRQRRLQEHMGYMAMSFACLLVAPLLRLNWVWLAWLFPAIDQETLNVVTLGFMLPQCMLIGYGLVLANRQHGRSMRKREPSDVAQVGARLFKLTYPAWVALAMMLVAIQWRLDVFGQGMVGLNAAHALVPAALLAQVTQVFEQAAWLPRAMGLALGAALLLCLSSLRALLDARDTPPETALRQRLWLQVALSSVAGSCAVALGWRLGLTPHLRTLSGGTMYTASGLLLLASTLLTTGALLADHLALLKESLVWQLAVLPFTSLFYLLLWAMQWAPLPPAYIEVGQAYILPAASSLGLMLAAMFYVIHGQATREHG